MIQRKRSRGRPPHPDLLTPAEWRITHAVQHGLTNRQIAALKGVSLDAVKYHLSNVLGKLQLPDRRALRQWFRLPRDSALYNQKHHMSPAAMTTPPLGSIGQIARTVSDIKASTVFYGNVLGLTHLYSFDAMAFFNCGGTRLMLTQKASTVPESVLYFRVEDIGQAHQRLCGQGVSFMGAPHLIHRHTDGTEEWMAFFKDPDGQLLALMAQVKP